MSNKTLLHPTVVVPNTRNTKKHYCLLLI